MGLSAHGGHIGPFNYHIPLRTHGRGRRSGYQRPPRTDRVERIGRDVPEHRSAWRAVAFWTIGAPLLIAGAVVAAAGLAVIALVLVATGHRDAVADFLSTVARTAQARAQHHLDEPSEPDWERSPEAQAELDAAIMEQAHHDALVDNAFYDAGLTDLDNEEI